MGAFFMGMQDRDYWREWHNSRERVATRPTSRPPDSWLRRQVKAFISCFTITSTILIAIALVRMAWAG